MTSLIKPEPAYLSPLTDLHDGPARLGHVVGARGEGGGEGGLSVRAQVAPYRSAVRQHHTAAEHCTVPSSIGIGPYATSVPHCAQHHTRAQYRTRRAQYRTSKYRTRELSTTQGQASA
eukprot:2457614-Rhodomonas_salina.2